MKNQFRSRELEDERFRTLAEAMPQMVWMTLPDGYNIYSNRRWTDYLGVPVEETYGNAWVPLLHPDDRDRVLEAWQTARETEQLYEVESRVRWRDGSYHWMLIRGLPLRDETGRIAYWLGTTTDIHELKQALEAARAGEQERAMLASALEHEKWTLIDIFRQAPNFMAVVRGPEHVFEYANDAYYDVVGHRDVLGRRVVDALPEVVEQGFVDLLDRVFATGQPIVQHSRPIWLWRRSQAEPEERIVDFVYHPLTDNDGTVTGILAQGSDVTERYNAQKQLLRAQRMESIGTLAGGIAHDLNNLLMPVLIGAKLLEHYATGEQARRAIAMIEQSARRGGELVNRILSFARGADGTRLPLHIRDIVHEVQAIVRSTFPRDITLDVSVPDDLWRIEGEPTELHQVLLNLCVNARDAMPHGGRLMIAAENVIGDPSGIEGRRSVRLTVSDTGTGIPDEIIERIFDPFFTTKGPGHGSGLGLATAAAIVRAHGGTIAVQSKVGRGTTFEIRLPAQVEVPLSAPATERAAVKHGEGELILLVDDEKPVLSVLRETLENAGYRTLTAENGALGMALFARHRDDIAAVITDMMMPVVDGAALIAQLRNIEPHLPIIVSSGWNGDARWPKMPTGYFLRKPYDDHALLATLRRALDERVATAE